MTIGETLRHYARALEERHLRHILRFSVRNANNDNAKSHSGASSPIGRLKVQPPSASSLPHLI